MNMNHQFNYNNNINNGYNTHNMNLNFGKYNNNFDMYDQTRNKFSMKFFEKLNYNNSNIKNNKGIKYSNLNDLQNTFNKNKINNIKKDVIQIYNKDLNNFKNKSNEKILMKRIKTRQLSNLGNNADSKNNVLSSSFTNKNSNNLNTINIEGKKIKNKNIIKLNSLKLEKNSRNISNSGNNIAHINKNSYISSSPINGIEKADNHNTKSHFENTNNYNKTPIISKNNTNINIINKYTEDKDNENNNLAIDAKKLSIIDIPAPKTNNNSVINTKESIFNISKKYLNLSIKEKAFYILSKSPTLPLTSQLIFSRSTKNIKNIVLKKDILLNYELFLNKKISNYEERQIQYTEKINSIFDATKIAEITLNFITFEREKQFKDNYILLLNNKEDENFIYYKNYIKIIYYIINENLEDENKKEINDNRLLMNLYDILKKKGYETIKDYLYFLFISNSNKRQNIFMNNIEKINKLIKNESPELLSYDESFKMGRFVVYSMYLIKEIVAFANMIKDTVKLKMEENELIEKMKEKLEKFHNKYLK